MGRRRRRKRPVGLEVIVVELVLELGVELEIGTFDKQNVLAGSI